MSRVRTLLACGALVAMAAGCGGGGSSPPSTTGPGPVRGTRTITYWQDDGTTIVRPDVPAGLAISVLVPEAGGYRRIAGSVKADGSFSVPYQGTASYFLELVEPSQAPFLIQLTTHEVELGSDLMGRPDATRAASSTLLSLDVSGLAPWATGDQLTLYSSGPRLERSHTGGTPSPGATAGRPVFDLQGLLLPAAGELGWLVQTSASTSTAGRPYRRVLRQAALQATQDLADGAQATLGPSPLTAPATSPQALDVRLSEFAARTQASGGGVAASFGSVVVGVRAYPRGRPVAPTIPLVAVGPLAGAGDVDLGSIDVPRFLPPSFVEHLAVNSLYSFGFEAALGLPATTFAFAGTRGEPLAGAAGVVRPGITGVRQVRVAGRDASQIQEGVGLTPTLTWSPPATGTARRYVVAVLDRSAGTFAIGALVAVTSDPTLSIPEGVLQPGHVYFASISAVADPNFDERRPIRTSFPVETFMVVTSLFTP